MASSRGRCWSCTTTLYHNTWSEEPLITAEEFACRIELVTVDVPSDGEDFTLWFTDGDEEMFGEHSIVAWFGADRRLRCAHPAA